MSILELEPGNIQGLHNLCVVFVERGKLLEAESCLHDAHILAPNEDYILRHLQIVQSRISKLRLNPPDISDSETISKEKSQVVSNKSIDENDKKTTPLVTGDSEEQRYSSRVVNTEPMFVKDVDNIEHGDYSLDESTFSGSGNLNFRKWNEVGTDNDDPSSGMS